MALKTMSVAKLQALKSQVEAAITKRSGAAVKNSKQNFRSLVVLVAAENAENLRDGAEWGR